MPANARPDHRGSRRRASPPTRGETPAAAAYRRAVALHRLGKLQEAIAAYDEALRLQPCFPEALHAGGTILRDLGWTDDALRFLREAIRLRPGFRDAVLDCGNLLCGLYRFDEALAVFDAASVERPNDAALLVNRGVALHELGRLADACASCEAAIAADATLPEAHLNHANVLTRWWRHADALPAYDRAIALRPAYPAAHSGRGMALLMLGRFADAEAAFATAVAQEPDNAYALTNRGRLRLLQGDYGRGLPDYEHRLRTAWEDLGPLLRDVPFWTGQPLRDQRVVTFADQGNGDIIHFARYVPLLIEAGADVTVVCRPRLQRLLRPVTTGARVVATPEPGDRFDLQIPFASLPYAFATRVETIPATCPYLAAETDRVATWAERLRGVGGEFRIGLCWRGSHDWRADPRRSVPPALLVPLAALPGVRLISLQVDADETARALPMLEHFAEADADGDAFIDTAAMMANLDLVVSCDTSIAHLAGALARPTFLLLQAVPEWRWLIGREDTPWYPTIRLFRQRDGNDWTETVERLVAAVKDLLGRSEIRTRRSDQRCSQIRALPAHSPSETTTTVMRSHKNS